jgi:Protein of unknown function (DUF2695)
MITASHPKWSEFCQRLDDAIAEKCFGDHEWTSRMLACMGESELEIEKTINYLKEVGAACDCRVLEAQRRERRENL